MLIPYLSLVVLISTLLAVSLGNAGELDIPTRSEEFRGLNFATAHNRQGYTVSKPERWIRYSGKRLAHQTHPFAGWKRPKDDWKSWTVRTGTKQCEAKMFLSLSSQIKA